MCCFALASWGRGAGERTVFFKFQASPKKFSSWSNETSGIPLNLHHVLEKTSARERKASRLPDATRKRIKLFHHEHPVLNVADSHTQVCSLRERTERERTEFSFGERKTVFRRGNCEKCCEWEGKFFATTSVVEISRRKETWNHSSFDCLLFDRKSFKGNDNQLDENSIE